MEHLPSPEVLSDGDAENWNFRHGTELHFTATSSEKKERTPAQKAAVFLYAEGHGAIDVVSMFPLTEAQRRDYEGIVKALVDYYSPKCNDTYERYVFQSEPRQHGESFEQFIRNVQLTA